jgi:prepilin-type N-terminal cleavage/methylation domain-containing protein
MKSLLSSMEMFSRQSVLGGTPGFSLVEILIVIIIIGVLAVISVPQYFKVLEKSRVGEAVDVFQFVRGAEDRYFAKYGSYCLNVAGCAGMDLAMPGMKYFATPGLAANGSSWKATLVRNGTPAIYGSYTLTYDPAVAPPISCNVAACQSDLMPQ